MNWVTRANAPLLTDLYELTMAASYFSQDMHHQATFDLFVRKLPERRNFLIACGLEQALDYLENFRFDEDAIEYLRSLGSFKSEFLDYLSELQFTGDIWAIPEGEVAFAGEPLLRVSGPLIEAQIVETFLLNCVTYQTMIASKAARVALAAGSCGFVDFSPRRDHGADAALKAARASYVAGASATSNVLAGKLYAIPVSGTMAHSYVMAFESEIQAFRSFARDFPDSAVLLIDTFDVEQGARRVAQIAGELASEGIEIKAVRIDSGDLAWLSRAVRKILDDAGLQGVEIFLSGDLDEYKIKQLLDEGTPVNAFGVGTQLGTSGDAAWLGTVYKLVAHDGRPVIKLSTGKVTLPGEKQVYRVFSDDGTMDHDVIALEDERVAGGRPLLRQVMTLGRHTEGPEQLNAIRDRCGRALETIPPALKELSKHTDYGVERSPGLDRLVAEMQGRGSRT